MAEAFNNQNLLLTGQPRDDIFYDKINRNEILARYSLLEHQEKKIVTYLPTFRDTRKTERDYILFNENSELREKLNKQGVLVIQKNHNSKITDSLYFGNVLRLSDDVDTQELLSITDLLVTDYSSCYIDYLHTQQPIIFYPYDLEDYQAYDRELYFDYNDPVITPGVKVKDEASLTEAVLQHLMEPKMGLEQRRKSLELI